MILNHNNRGTKHVARDEQLKVRTLKGYEQLQKKSMMLL